MTKEEMIEFGAMLRSVGVALNHYGRDLIEAGMRNQPKPDFQWSTYALEAQAAVYDLMKKDGLL